MKNAKTYFCLLLALPLLTLALPAHSSEVDIQWQEPEKYTDIRPSHSSRKKFQARVFKHLGEEFQEVAAQLPEGYSLSINVTNVDLAGDVRFNFGTVMREIRIMTDIYSPKLNFSYEVKDANNETVAAGEEKIRDMNYLQRVRSLRSEPFKYERDMIKNWYRKDLAPQLAQS